MFETSTADRGALSAFHRGDSADVAQHSPHNPVRVTTLSKDGKAPRGGLKFLGLFIENAGSC